MKKYLVYLVDIIIGHLTCDNGAKKEQNHTPGKTRGETGLVRLITSRT